jgi:hypothetical protein
MRGVRRAQFQEAAVRHIVSRFRDPHGSKRVLLADEVGLGKTVVARGVIEQLMERRRSPLTVVYLCSNAEIAEQNRTKLDPDSAAPVGRVTELAFKAKTPDANLRLYSFTPGTSLKGGTGLEWERRLLMYLLHRAFGFRVWKRQWREFFRCGVRPENWDARTTRRALTAGFGRQTTRVLQRSLKAAWSRPIGGRSARAAIHNAVVMFDPDDPESKSRRNQLVAQLRGVMQRVVLRCLEPDLLILDEVQRFRDVIEEAETPDHIAAELFARRVPVLILSATPYRALTLGHELADGVLSHHEDFFTTLEFLFDRDRATPAAIRTNLRAFGERLRALTIAVTLDHDLLALKHRLEDDLRRVICRTERNWYVMDRRKGIDDTAAVSRDMPGRAELEEFFRLHVALAPLQAIGQVTEFWKSAPSLLTFMDGRYALFKKLKEEERRVPRELLTTGAAVGALGRRNHRISKVTAVAVGPDKQQPPLWMPPTYPYYRDAGFFGETPVRKMLVFSGWRFVPKAVAVITSQLVTNRFGGLDDAPTQPLRFSADSLAFHPLDICYPSIALAAVAEEPYRSALRRPDAATAEDVLAATEQALRRHLAINGVSIVKGQGDPMWRVVMRLERANGGLVDVEHMLDSWEKRATATEGAQTIRLHRRQLSEWLADEWTPVRLGEGRARRLAMIAAFSPACSLLRAVQSVFHDESPDAYLPSVAGVTLEAMRRYFNKPHVQKAIRNHQFRKPWRSTVTDDDPGYTERVLAYAADGQFQAVMDEYVYLLRHAAQAETAATALRKVEEVLSLARGTPRTNGPRGTGRRVRINPDAESHATHFALAFGDDDARESSPEVEEAEEKQRKSVIREAFNSPFWPFVLATTSVGQEGLDFHLYCRDILHWNLPSNPVDLEQREGRINRRDCLAVRQSIARDWPVADIVRREGSPEQTRNPWNGVFDAIMASENPQKYKHGLFPHWVYECRDPQSTVRIRRHVPFFATSRDAQRYERLKEGLALYRLVFGQVNQQDLLEDLHEQIAALPQDEHERAFRRLASYMLNLSPVSHDEAIAHAAEEADGLLSARVDRDGVERLLASVAQLRRERAAELSAVAGELDWLVGLVREFLDQSKEPSEAVRTAATALAYLRNPYDRIFDLHVEGGLSDDIDVIRQAWVALGARADGLKISGGHAGGHPPRGGRTATLDNGASS